MGPDATEDICEVGDWLDAISFAGGDQGVEPGDIVARLLVADATILSADSERLLSGGILEELDDLARTARVPYVDFRWIDRLPARGRRDLIFTAKRPLGDGLERHAQRRTEIGLGGQIEMAVLGTVGAARGAAAAPSFCDSAQTPPRPLAPV